MVDHVWTNVYAEVADCKYPKSVSNDGERYDEKDEKPPFPFRLEKKFARDNASYEED